MNDSPTSKKLFNEIESIKLCCDEVSVGVDNTGIFAHVVLHDTDPNGPTILDMEDALALRSWLNRALPADEPKAHLAAFKNFHRLLCERFGYVHDEKEWDRDQLSLIEHIAARISDGPGTCPHTPDGKHSTHDGGPDCRYCDGIAQPPPACTCEHGVPNDRGCEVHGAQLRAEDETSVAFIGGKAGTSGEHVAEPSSVQCEYCEHPAVSGGCGWANCPHRSPPSEGASHD